MATSNGTDISTSTDLIKSGVRRLLPPIMSQSCILMRWPFQDPHHPANLICELCRNFYSLGWVTGTGGGISIRREYGQNLRFSPLNRA